MVKKSISFGSKISILVFVSIFILNQKTFAQGNETVSDHKGAVTFGLLHSFNLTTISGGFPTSNFGNSETKTSILSPRFTFDLGMTVDYYLTEKFSVQFDFLYTYQGAHLISKTYLYNEVGKVENKKYFTYAMDYFKFPLTINYYPQKNLYVNAGGYFSSIISSTEYEYWYDRGDPIDDIKAFDYGVTAGFGFNTAYAKIGFQYSYGINNFMTANNYDLHNNVFQIIVRWKFYSDLRKKGL